jgi:imidazolonepropionase-like amidohydrolase
MPHEVPTWFGESVREMVRGGAKVGMGSHGQLQGLGAHWEVWALAGGGLTPLEAIRTATATAAELMGMQDDIGSLEPGKLADLMVLDRNPLEDLKNTNSIRYVMKAGTLWEGDTLNEVWPTKRTRPKPSWET